MLSLSDLFMSMLSMSGSWLSEGGRRIIWRSLCHLDLNKGNWRTVSHGLFSRLSISEYFSLTLLCCRRCERCVEVRRVIASVEDETATARCDGTCPSDHQSPRPGCLPDPGLPTGLRAAIPRCLAPAAHLWLSELIIPSSGRWSVCHYITLYYQNHRAESCQKLWHIALCYAIMIYIWPGLYNHRYHYTLYTIH